jgi:hypothetical protein
VIPTPFTKFWHASKLGAAKMGVTGNPQVVLTCQISVDRNPSKGNATPIKLDGFSSEFVIK